MNKLNEILGGGKPYYTPVAVMGDLINQEGGQVTIINPPYDAAPERKRGLKENSYDT